MQFDQLKRREFITLLGGAAASSVCWPLAARAQEPGRVEHARPLVKARVDVIVAGGDAAVCAAQHATTEIPIVGMTEDMVGQGFVRSLAKPGGNTTGVSILFSDLDGKRQEILIEAMPAFSALRRWSIAP
jgi:ABC-type uncharacterized transport system substrate-binding protein